MKSSFQIQVTMVANQFIDEYMAFANGEYVKVYLYILRHAGESMTVGTIADGLNDTEADVCRAIVYWKKQGVLAEEGAAIQSAQSPQGGAQASSRGAAYQGGAQTPLRASSFQGGAQASPRVSAYQRGAQTLSRVSPSQGGAQSEPRVSSPQGGAQSQPRVAAYRRGVQSLSGASAYQGAAQPPSEVAAYQESAQTQTRAAAYQGGVQSLSGASAYQGDAQSSSGVSTYQGGVQSLSGASVCHGAAQSPSEASAYQGAAQSPSEASAYQETAQSLSGASAYPGVVQSPSGASVHPGAAQSPAEASAYQGAAQSPSEASAYQGAAQSPSGASSSQRAISSSQGAVPSPQGARTAAALEKNKPPVTAGEEKLLVARPAYTPEQVNKLASEEDFTQLLYIAQKYLNKVFTPRDCELFAYLYDGLQMSAELLEYLVEYCVQNGHDNFRYMETVALNWHEQGIRTVNDAKTKVTDYTKDTFAVMKAFGLGDRKPANVETEMIRRWFKEYGFSRELVVEACNRTMRAIHNPSFQYADKILGEWMKAGVKSMRDIQTLDDKRESKTSKPPVQPKTGRNQFHNFEQRDTDYDAMVLERVKERLKERMGEQ